LQKTDILVI